MFYSFKGFSYLYGIARLVLKDLKKKQKYVFIGYTRVLKNLSFVTGKLQTLLSAVVNLILFKSIFLCCFLSRKTSKKCYILKDAGKYKY